MDLKELIDECKKKQADSLNQYKDARYLALGYYNLDKITLPELTGITTRLWNEHLIRSNDALFELAVASNDPLVKWIAQNVPNKATAFHLIKHLPMDLEQIDRFAKRNRWCAAYYNQHRPDAIAAKVVFEYKEDANANR